MSARSDLLAERVQVRRALDQMTIHFRTSAPEVRAAIEAKVARLEAINREIEALARIPLANWQPAPELPGWELGWDDLGRPMDPPEVWGG